MKIFFKYFLLKKIYYFYPFFLLIFLNKKNLTYLRLKKKEEENSNTQYNFSNFGFRFLTKKESSYFFSKYFFFKSFKGYSLVYFFSENYENFQYLIKNFLVLESNYSEVEKKKDFFFEIITAKLFNNFLLKNDFLYLFLSIKKNIFIFKFLSFFLINFVNFFFKTINKLKIIN